ncbi:hypothetical protein QYE76_071606 [Lolium multiflorum]|uniref:F-box domain-containing protein n=1 Tax=Lolium multiflorum TaxID=4521 RepID=A0AAD8SLW6_LOLMU|nr:hypothetical protein QYE76_071606 [Lolium multiflorum]
MEDGEARHGGGLNLGPGGGGEDLISALPEDLLLQILVRLRCARAAARTSPVSRRWRALWTRLPELTFRDVALGPLLQAIASLQAAAAGAGVPLLDICIVPIFFDSHDENAQFREGVSSLLHAAARLSTVELRFAVRPEIFTRSYMDVKAPLFHRATSIELHGLDLVFPGSQPRWLRLHLAPSIRLERVYTDPRDTFPALESLSLSSCSVDLTDLVLRCPRLRELREADGPQYSDIIIRSATLQELDMNSDTPFMFCIHIDAPALKQLALSFSTGGGITVAVSILAPLLEKVSWWCRYTTVTVGLGRWGLYKVTLKPAERHAQRDLTRSGEDDCLQLLHAHVLSLYSFAHISFSFPEAAAELTTEIEKHTIIHFSVLELHFMTRGHVFGALALHILGMHRICTATRSLKIVLWKEDKEACPVNCTCDEPRNWRSQSIFLTNLENIEIKGFEGENHEFNFLELLLRCATMLKRLTVRPSDEVTTSNDWCTKIYDIFKAYPIVECNLDLIPGSTQDSHSGAST